MITNSITFSCSRLVELLEEFNSKKIDWNKESTTSTIKEVERIKEKLNQQFNSTKSGNQMNVEEKLEDLDKALATLQKLTSKQ